MLATLLPSAITWRVAAVLSALSVAHVALAVEIPPPTGKYFVGTTQRVVEFYNPNDPVAPNHISTSFLARLFYPTLHAPCGAPKPYLNPETAALWEEAWGYSEGVLASLTSTVQKEAPWLPATELDGPLPTLIFGGGGAGPPSECYTILLSELASRGYLVVGLDHPYEQPFVRYPNGTGVYGLPVLYDFPEGLDSLMPIYQVRLNDTLEFLSQWPTIAAELGAPVALDHLGVFGHSLGGAVSINAAILTPQETISSVLNMDGAFYGDMPATSNGPSADAKRPVLLFGQELIQNEDSWNNFAAAQTGWWRKIGVKDSAHHDFSDGTFWKEVGENSDPSAGPINGVRMVEIYNEFVTAFFNYTLLGQEEPILTVPGSEWPEVFFYDGSNGTAV